MSGNVDPSSLDIKGSTQPEILRDIVDAMVQELHSDASSFWRDALANDGPIEIWELNGERFLYNGNHRYHAAAKAGVNIPVDSIKIVDRSGSPIPTFWLKDIIWL